MGAFVKKYGKALSALGVGLVAAVSAGYGAHSSAAAAATAIVSVVTSVVVAAVPNKTQPK